MKIPVYSDDNLTKGNYVDILAKDVIMLSIEVVIDILNSNNNKLHYILQSKHVPVGLLDKDDYYYLIKMCEHSEAVEKSITIKKVIKSVKRGTKIFNIDPHQEEEQNYFVKKGQTLELNII